MRHTLEAVSIDGSVTSFAEIQRTGARLQRVGHGYMLGDRAVTLRITATEACRRLALRELRDARKYYRPWKTQITPGMSLRDIAHLRDAARRAVDVALGAQDATPVPWSSLGGMRAIPDVAKL